MRSTRPLKLAIGLDVGGTKTRAILWDGKKILKILDSATPQDPKEFVANLRRLVTSLQGDQKIRGIGIGIAGAVKKDVIVSCRNIPAIRELSVLKIFPGVARIKLDNDARCFARCEVVLGSGKSRAGSKRGVLALTIGTGIGRAYSANGKVKPLESFEHSELWEGAYQRQRDAKKPALLAKLLGVKLAPIIHRLQPHAIVVGGSVMYQPQLFGLLQKELRREGILTLLKKPQFRENAGAIGAALLVS